MNSTPDKPWIRGIHPRLWRRFLVRSDSTLADLHVLLQIDFDWTDFHLHRFRIRKKDYAVPRLGGPGCMDKLERRPALMKLKLQLIIESDSGETEMVQEVAKLERYALRPETLGLTLSEAKELLQEVQRAMVTHQTTG